MVLSEVCAIGLYVILLICIAVFTHKKDQTSADFIIGGRGLNFWLTALAAHASDMSSWIFMGYPVVLFTSGIFEVWLAVGLTLCMFINWHWIAPKVRTATEKFDAMTFSSFFESRFRDTSGGIRIVTALMCLFFYTIYISTSFYGLGLLFELVFGIPYMWGLVAGVFIVTPYLFVGGYITLAWTDFFQGLFLLLVIMVVPIVATFTLGGTHVIDAALNAKNYFHGLIPGNSFWGVISALFVMLSWGLGYFGQPHIITKFMGIRDVKEMRKSKYVGMTWQVLILTSATFVAMVAIAYFQGGIDNKQLIFPEMVRGIFPSFLGTFVLCAMIGATLTHADSQLLVLSSTLTEDFYRRIIRKTASSKELLLVSRLSILLVAAVAFAIASQRLSTIFELVEFAWFGLGSAFGPILIFALYSKSANKYGAYAGVISGGVIAAVWELINHKMGWSIPTLIPGFGISSFLIWFVSKVTGGNVYEKTQSINHK